ncbi:MAG: hypothetical protein NC394_09520 [Bacteroides sp.]|nr:hypothetical protein [Bacteroides sp.]
MRELTEISGDTGMARAKAEMEKETGELRESSAAPQIKEIGFFTAPKRVKKKTEGSIIAFQVIFTAVFCLMYRLSAIAAPELYFNINAYLERLFGW